MFANLLQALVRDVREYLTKNSAQSILIGAPLERYEEIDIKPDNLMWLTCNVTNESVSSAIDVIYLETEELRFVNKTQSRTRINDLRRFLNQTGYETPMLLGNYKTLKKEPNADSRGYTDNETVAHDNDIFFGSEGWFTYKSDVPFMGISRDSW